MAWGRKTDLPEGLFDNPLLGHFFRDFRCFCYLFNGRKPFLVALGAVVDFGEFGIHYFYDIAECRHAGSNNKQLALFLLLAGLIKVRELRICQSGCAWL